MEQSEKARDRSYDHLYFCPLCMRMQEFAVACFEMIDEKFTKALMLEFKEINEKQDKVLRAEILSKNQMRLSSATLDEMK